MKRILIFYDHFYPSFKAGGPTLSIVNLIRQLRDQYEFYVVCKPHEMGECSMLEGIKINQWNEWEKKTKVFYWNYSFNKRRGLKRLVTDLSPDIVYINGIYSFYFNLMPLKYALDLQKKSTDLKIVLSSRGMLHPGALSQKPLKKKVYIGLFRLLGLHKKVNWHATDNLELEFIHQVFGEKINTSVAGNFPNLLSAVPFETKKAGMLKLGTIALISPMKNHLLVLQALQFVTALIEWHIYGPIKDEKYWKACRELIQKLPSNIIVHYHGECKPAEVSLAMKHFQVFIMPSKSENFGHAILEALSAGRPVITTDTTPFKALQYYGAGYTVSADNIDELTEAILFSAEMDEDKFSTFSSNASLFAAGFSKLAVLKDQYRHLFA